MRAKIKIVIAISAVSIFLCGVYAGVYSYVWTIWHVQGRGQGGIDIAEWKKTYDLVADENGNARSADEVKFKALQLLQLQSVDVTGSYETAFLPRSRQVAVDVAKKIQANASLQGDGSGLYDAAARALRRCIIDYADGPASKVRECGNAVVMPWGPLGVRKDAVSDGHPRG
jgi:hypothetical protein